MLEEPNKAPMADGPVAFQRLPVDHERNSPVGLLQKKPEIATVKPNQSGAATSHNDWLALFARPGP